MRTSAVLLVCLLAAMLGLPADASAATWCRDSEPDPNHPLSWERLGPRVMAEVAAARYEAGYRVVFETFLREYGEAASREAEVRAFREAFHEYLALRERAGDQPVRWRGEWDADDDVQEYFLLAPDGAVEQVRIPCAEIADPQAHAVSARVAVAYAAFALEQATGSDLDEARRAAARRAQALYGAYEQWLFDGLAQWPWELWLNGRRLPRDFADPPPRWQWIALRPNASLVANLDTFEDSALDYALTFEPIGFVRYVEGSSYRKWWGLSPTLTLTGDHGAGYGLLGRYNNFVLGAAYHERDERVLWYMSVDLYRYALGEEGKVRQARTLLDRVKGGLAGDLLR
jgi:hypothetical protein